MGKVAYFHITYDNSVCLTGSELTGNVTFKLKEPVQIREVALQLVGECDVKWQTDLGDYVDQHKAHEIYFRQTIILYRAGGTDEDKVLMTAGQQYNYSFSYTIPAGVPSTCSFRYGHVSYQGTASLVKNSGYDKITQAPFQVINSLDLNTIAGISDRMEGSGTADVVSFFGDYKGSVTAKFSINKTGFTPGESVLVNAVVNNNSKKSMQFSQVQLEQHVVHTAEREASRFPESKENTKPEKHIVTCRLKPKIKRGMEYRWEDYRINIPDLPPSGLSGCNAIDVCYTLRFLVDDEINIATKVVIGTVPIRAPASFDELMIPLMVKKPTKPVSSIGKPRQDSNSPDGATAAPPPHRDSTEPLPPNYEEFMTKLRLRDEQQQ